MNKWQGTVHASHIELPVKEFFVRFYRPSYFNEYHHDGGERVVRVLACTEEGALAIARYHWSRGSNFVINDTITR